MANPPQTTDVTTAGYAPDYAQRQSTGTYIDPKGAQKIGGFDRWVLGKKQSRAASKAKEAGYRESADQLQQDALNSARNMQGQVPFLRDQLAQVQQLWNGGSQEATAQADAQGLAAQRQSLGQLQEMARQGFNSQDEASLQAANRQANMNEQAQRQAVQQQAAMSGQRGGGLAMMGAMMAQQGGANRAADQAAQIGQARIAARQNAVGQVNQAGANLAQQTFGQQQARGAATDAFNQAMMGNQQQLTQQNFQNKLGASQNFTQAAQNTAQYDQSAADAERKRRNAKLNFFMNPTGGMK